MIRYRSPHALLLVAALLAVAACRTSGAATPGASGQASLVLGNRPLMAHAPRTAAFDVDHYALDLELDPAGRRIDGTCTVRVFAREAPVEHVELDLVGLAVAEVRDPEGRTYWYRHEDGELDITLIEPLPPGVPLELVIAYGGRPAKGLWFSAERDGVPTQVFTQGECEDSRWWFPCWDFPSDRATSEVRVKMPASWTSVAAGELVDRTEGPGWRRDHWRMTTPHPSYLVTLVAGELAELEDEWDGVPLTSLARPELAEWMPASFERTGDVLAFLSDVTGRRYPYAKYSQACVDNFPFGGMENISATTVTEWTLKDERGHRDDPSIGLVVHEAAHQWFGDLLTCADWSHIWLNEGFATYMTLMWYEHAVGREEFLVRLRDTQESYMSHDLDEKRRPVVHDVYRDPMDLFGGGHTYQGGAVRLHLLRHIVGDEAFFRGVRTYVGENENRSVVTGDLRSAMERVSGQDLGFFFDQWLHGPGFPELEVAWKWDDGKVELQVAQVQERVNGTPEVFYLPVDVEVRTATGATLHRVQLNQRRQTFDLPADSEPVWVRFDKGGAIPKALRSRKNLREWVAIARGDDDPNGRRDAVAALGKATFEASGDRQRGEIAAVLSERAIEDVSWAVRQKAVSALEPLVSPLVRRTLLEAASADPDTRVRVQALNALAAQARDADRDEARELAAFGREQFEAGYSWRTMGAAARLVCVGDPDDSLDWAVERMALESPHGRLRAYLIEALETLPVGDVFDIVRREALDESSPDHARIAAVRALGRFGTYRTGVRADLLSLLESDNYQLRRAVLAAFEEMKDPRALRALKAYHRDTPFPRERRTIEETVRRTTLEG